MVANSSFVTKDYHSIGQFYEVFSEGTSVLPLDVVIIQLVALILMEALSMC